MTRLHYHLVDVFTDRQFGGNPLAVFLEGTEVPPEVMQRLARELNLSETTFVLPPEDNANDFRVRIFTPGAELPMAGHPTVGTSFVLARQRMVPLSAEGGHLRLEEGVGLIPVTVRYRDDQPVGAQMTQPLPTFGPRVNDVGQVAEMLSLPPDAVRQEFPVEVVSCGVPFLYVPLRDLESVRRARLRPDVAERLLGDVPTHEIFIFTQEVEHMGSTVHSRMFAPGLGVAEDPATGAASGPLGCYLVRYGLVPASPAAQIVSEQGIEMGRPSFIEIEIETQAGQITAVRVGGECVYVGEGFIELT